MAGTDPAACRQRAVRLVRRGNGQLSAEATAGRKVADSLAGQAVNGHSSGGIEQIVADLHLRRDNRHAGPAQLRDVRRHSLTAEPEQGVESGDRQAGVQRLAEPLPGRLYLPGNLLVRGRRQPGCIDATNAVCQAVMKGFRDSL